MSVEMINKISLFKIIKGKNSTFGQPHNLNMSILITGVKSSSNKNEV